MTWKGCQLCEEILSDVGYFVLSERMSWKKENPAISRQSNNPILITNVSIVYVCSLFIFYFLDLLTASLSDGHCGLGSLTAPLYLLIKKYNLAVF